MIERKTSLHPVDARSVSARFRLITSLDTRLVEFIDYVKIK